LTSPPVVWDGGGKEVEVEKRCEGKTPIETSADPRWTFTHIARVLSNEEGHKAAVSKATRLKCATNSERKDNSNAKFEIARI